MLIGFHIIPYSLVPCINPFYPYLTFLKLSLLWSKPCFQYGKCSERQTCFQEDKWSPGVFVQLGNQEVSGSNSPFLQGQSWFHFAGVTQLTLLSLGKPGLKELNYCHWNVKKALKHSQKIKSIKEAFNSIYMISWWTYMISRWTWLPKPEAI